MQRQFGVAAVTAKPRDAPSGACHLRHVDELSCSQATIDCGDWWTWHSYGLALDRIMTQHFKRPYFREGSDDSG